MKRQIPKRLRQEPLIEAIWQVQFEPAPNHPLGDILPGILFSVLRTEQPELKINRLPLAEMPAAMAALDPNLRHAAKYRIEAPDWPFLFHIGDRIVTVNCRQPYVGWDRFKSRIISLINVLDECGLIPEPRQHALRYIDLLTLEPPPALASLQLALNIGEHRIDQHPVQMRVELPDQGCRHVVQVVTPAEVKLPDGPRQGTLIDLETISVPDPSNWCGIQDGLDPLHRATKALFFGQILTEEAIGRMDPEY